MSKLQDYAAIGEIVSAAAVVITLIVLILEIRENTELMRATNAAASRDSLVEINEMFLNFDDPTLELMNRTMDRSVTIDSLSDIEQIKLVSFVRVFLRRSEAQYFRYKAGILDQAVWNTVRRRVIVNLTLSSWWTIWQTEKDDVYTPDFIAEIEANLPVDWERPEAD